MMVIPAIDVLGDETVRLVEGDFERVSLRRGDPADAARSFAAGGARLVHLVDLDGARSGRVRPQLVARVVDCAAPAAVQASGGIRSLADADALLAAGAARVVVGTAAFSAPDAPARFAEALGERLVVALDAREGRIAVGGWLADTGVTVEEAADRCAAAGVRRVVCTAIERDGTATGPDLDLLRRVCAASDLAVLAAGGIANEADLDDVAATGAEGAIVGRALLDGSLPLRVLHRSAR